MSASHGLRETSNFFMVTTNLSPVTKSTARDILSRDTATVKVRIGKDQFLFSVDT